MVMYVLLWVVGVGDCVLGVYGVGYVGIVGFVDVDDWVFLRGGYLFDVFDFVCVGVVV